MEITFIKTFESVSDEYAPKPASGFVPSWYKDMASYVGGDTRKPSKEGVTNGTIKRCMPVFDAITSGYIIPTYVDVYVTQDENEGIPFYQWPSQNPISWHPVVQAPTHPLGNGVPYPKWMNPWAIKTPKGYSCLFVSPFHHDLPFTILPGVVDTDEYYAPVNFPFVLKDRHADGLLIPAGTPMAQVIPFKREDWESKVLLQDPKAIKEQHKISMSLVSGFFDNYKNKFRQKRSYK